MSFYKHFPLLLAFLLFPSAVDAQETGGNAPSAAASGDATDTAPADNAPADADTAASVAASDESAAATAVNRPGDADANAATKPADEHPALLSPLVILAIGICTVLGLIIGLKVNAFIALITAAMVVSLFAAGPFSVKVSRVAEAFGDAAGGIAIVIALAAVIGKCMLDSGAADRIVRAFLRVFGERQSPVALMGSGFVLAVPVFFDTVFYLLVPLARSLYSKTGRNYLMYILAIAAGGAITHTLVPPTPGPLVMAEQLGFDVGIMILVGGLVAFPAALAGLIFARIADSTMPIPMRQVGSEPDPKPLKDDELPPLWLAILPVALPVLMISANTVVQTLSKNPNFTDSLAPVAGYTSFFGNANFALLISTVVAMWTLASQRGLSKVEMAQVVETSLMSGGVIILITAGGGAFGRMLKVAEVGDAIAGMFSTEAGAGMTMLILGFSIAALLKVAQGSSTVAMITGSGMLAGLANPELLGFHPVYLATAIGGGSLIGSWMNDSGFWIFAKMGGLTEVEALKSWSIMLIVLGLVSFAMTILLAKVLPLV